MFSHFYIINFINSFYKNIEKDNNRETLKLELIPKDESKDGKLLSNEEIKLLFAKKG